MDRYKTTFETWNKVADLYQEKFMDLPFYNESYDLFCAKVRKQHASILEIGCGPGNITKYMLSLRPDFKFLATDISANMIRLAKENNPSAEVALMDSREIGRLAQKFDGIIAGFCMPYLSKEDVAQLLRDAASLLHPGGCIYLSMIEGDYENSGFMSGSTGDQTYVYFHSEKNIKELLLNNGFSVSEFIRIDYQKSNNSSEQQLVFIATKKAG